jgi:hypothetical protein
MLSMMPKRKTWLPVSGKDHRMNLIRRLSYCAAVFLGLAFFASASGAETGPFADLAGSWSGTGTVVLTGGPKERIRCRATYSVTAGGNGLRQNLRCASDSYQFDLSGNVRYLNGQLSGNWKETSRNIEGVLFGRARPGHYEATVTGPGFVANLSLTTSGNRQAVVINTMGGQSAGASITLTRAR